MKQSDEMLEMAAIIRKMPTDSYLPEEIAEELIENGFRKKDLIVKETAKSVLQNMLSKMYMLTGCGVPYHVKRFIETVAGEFGVDIGDIKLW